jgi:DNA-binding XRE family transcriptional regulator
MKELRTHFGLTQELMADWLGVPRASLALAESNHQNLPLTPNVMQQMNRLLAAKTGMVYGLAGRGATPPPLPAPPPEPEPLEDRLAYCRHHARNLRSKLSLLRAKADRYEARLVALPALRAWSGVVSDAALEASWLALFEGEAVVALRDTCGAGPQRLLEARIAGLEREAELLAELLAAPPA